MGRGKIVSWFGTLGRCSVLLAALAALTVAAGSAYSIRHSQAAARSAMQDRLATRADMGTRFVEAYAEDVLQRQSFQATTHIGTDPPSSAEFVEAVTDLGFQAGVLLDAEGRLLDIYPPNPNLLGKEMTSSYPHLASAVAGRPTASNVVSSAARGEPIVAFAVPYRSPAGLRVFSSGFAIAGTPLGAFLRTALPFEDHAMYLVDANGQIVASSDPDAASGLLAVVDPVLSEQSAVTASGFYDRDGDRQHFVTRPVGGTPWRLVLRVPTDVLYAPVAGTTRLPWAMFGLLVLTLCAGVALLARTAAHRSELSVLASQDALTGLYNRRYVAGRLGGDRQADAVRDATVLMIDADHFKQINDRHGHAHGDDVLRFLADAIRSCVRTEDVVGRWGGEEFIVVLPGTGTEEGSEVAERIRRAVMDRLPATVSVSIGLATGRLGEPLVKAADAALYEAKAAGRNCVVASSQEPVDLVT